MISSLLSLLVVRWKASNSNVIFLGVIILVAAAGGSARDLAIKNGMTGADLDDVDFAKMFYNQIGISQLEGRAR